MHGDSVLEAFVDGAFAPRTSQAKRYKERQTAAAHQREALVASAHPHGFKRERPRSDIDLQRWPRITRKCHRTVEHEANGCRCGVQKTARVAELRERVRNWHIAFTGAPAGVLFSRILKQHSIPDSTSGGGVTKIKRTNHDSQDPAEANCS